MNARFPNMKRIVLAAVVGLVGASFASAQSLGELGRKEQERREKLKDTAKVITNNEADRYKNGPVTTGKAVPAAADQKESADKGTPPRQGTDAAGAASAAAPKAASDEPTDFQGRPESFWRQTFTDARAKVKELENEGNVLTLRLNDLQNQFYREADGYRQQQIQRDINKTLYEQDQNKDKLAKAKSSLDDLEKEARKSGALPGWFQQKP
jgi:hypothetical protein